MIRHVLFDLDNTLYSASWGLEEFFFQKVWEFVASWLKLPPDEAKKIWEEGYKRNGTTAGWLKLERGLSTLDDYYAWVHPESEADCLVPDPGLRSFLRSLPCPSSVLTNSPRFHADRILQKLEIEDIFFRIFSIEDTGFYGKPEASAYRRALDELGLKPEDVLFIDDSPRYVEGYLALGGKGLLIDERDAHGDFPHERIKTLKEIVRFL